MATSPVSDRNHRGSVVVGAKRFSKITGVLIAWGLFGAILGGIVVHYVIEPYSSKMGGVYSTIEVYNEVEYRMATDYLKRLRAFHNDGPLNKHIGREDIDNRQVDGRPQKRVGNQLANRL